MGEGDVRMDRRGLLLRIALISLCVAALVAIAAVIGGDFDETTARAALTALAVAFYSVLSMPGFAAMEQPRLRVLGTWTAGACALSFVLAVAAIWADVFDDSGGGDDVTGWAVSGVVALSLSHGVLLILRRREDDPDRVRSLVTLTLGFVVCLGLFGCALILGEDASDDSLRILGVLAVLDVAGSLAIPITRALGRTSRSAPQAAVPGDASLAGALGLSEAMGLSADAFAVDPSEIDALVDRAEGIGARVLSRPGRGEYEDDGEAAVLADREGRILTLIARSKHLQG